MKEIWNQNKAFILIISATLALLIGGVTFFSNSSPTTTSGAKVSSAVLNGRELTATESATTILTEFGDYQCPACGVYHPLVKQLITEFAGKVTLIFRNFPLSQHPNSNISAQAVEAAGIQGKFWQMHDKVYESQSEWSNSTDAQTIFEDYAKSIGLDINKFKIDINSQIVKDKIQKDVTDANLIGINSTPTFYVNGVKLDTIPASYEELKKVIISAQSSK